MILSNKALSKTLTLAVLYRHLIGGLMWVGIGMMISGGLVMSTHAQSSKLPPVLSPAQQALIVQLDQHMNRQRTLTSRFIQLNPNGDFTAGTLWMRRPDQARFEYDPPSPLLLIASGNFFIEVDRELEQVSYYPQVDNIASYLLGENILQNPALIILEFNQRAGLIAVKIAEADEPDQATITLEFDAASLNLRNWTIHQPDGSTIKLTLTEPYYNLEFDEDLFHFHAPKSWVIAR